MAFVAYVTDDDEPITEFEVIVALSKIMELLDEVYENTRELALAKTKLDECGMWLERAKLK